MPNVKVGDRCKLLQGGHRGVVKYVGKILDLGIISIFILKVSVIGLVFN